MSSVDGFKLATETQMAGAIEIPHMFALYVLMFGIGGISYDVCGEVTYARVVESI